MTVTTPRTRPPGPIATELATLTDTLARCQWRIVYASAAFADSDEWVAAGAPTPAHYLAGLADVEVCTAREWIRVGRCVRTLPATADAFAARRLSYAKVRALTRFATPENELELIALAERIAEHTGQPVEQIQADSERDRWFTADEAREYGIVDHVITRRGDVSN